MKERNIYKKQACTRVMLHPGEVDKTVLTPRPELTVDGTYRASQKREQHLLVHYENTLQRTQIPALAYFPS